MAVVHSGVERFVTVGIFRFRLKYLALGVLTVQTSTMVLVLRYSRTVNNRTGQEPYLSSTAVFLSEVLKLFICLFIVLKDSRFHPKEFYNALYQDVFSKPTVILKMCVPAFLYTVQNNLLYLALSNLDAATYQVTYQLKILTTALFSVLLLGKQLGRLKWLSLVILMFGVTLVQWRVEDERKQVDVEDNAEQRNISKSLVGLVAVLCACFSSGFAGVYFEKVLKTSKLSLWMRNVQLALFGIILGLSAVYINDGTAIQKNGFFQGYNKYAWAVIFLQAFNGLVIATVVKYADNILKGFATSISIIVSSIISYYFLHDFEVSRQFLAGATAVLVATYIYSKPEKPVPQSSHVFREN
ncbi:LOW QUALITY PROTEIN: UDP-N-acetylglucosamine transporter-like [Dendronephthya gigantea]|uniref:LOW QUALITY PROTEIN: UDP-N-acetylglucosamine transporter-like n=1 Tax=Dendronephthya gigantea TaxID=151771 RepID=UPI001069C6AD|nr:LOW QUALITY PROTEIN: UDP-N-acetylglucosamine transporter-like [Dendronephthya gigantea]